MIFSALRSVCRCNVPTLLSALPALLSALSTLLSALSYIYKHIICCASTECGHREGVKFVGVTENLLSLCPSNASPMLLGFVVTRAGSADSVDKSADSAGKSVGSVDKGAGISPLYTLRNALKIS